MPVPEETGRYRVVRRLGAGAFAVVWLARDERLHADVAIKVMADNWACRLDVRERFVEEARLLRRAHSEGVVQVFDIGDLPDGRPYFVMEYADRGTLEDLLTAGEAGVDEALRLTARAARGVAALHAAGILHRDVKPSNVLLSGRPHGRERVLIGDLGLAKDLAQASGFTVVAGSSGYMAPEQAQPPADGLDARADVYGLGAVLHHLLTGTVPGPPGKVLPVDELRPGVPAPVRDAVLRAMEPDRDRRWPSAAAFAEELERLREPAVGAGGRAEAPATGAGIGAGAEDGAGGEAGAAAVAAAAEPVPDAVAPPGPAPRAASGEPGRAGTAPTRTRRSKGLLVGAAVLVLGAVAAGTVWTTTSGNPGTDSGVERVTDVTGRLSLEVPSAWAGQLAGSGWSPEAVGLDDGRRPALTVAGSVADWSDLEADVDGVFAGQVGADDDHVTALTGKVTKRRHPTCEDEGTSDYRDGAWRGTVHTWGSCGARDRVLKEVALTPVSEGSAPVFLQIRCDEEDGARRIARILRSVRATA
ncbi:serine/threonine-protein kinase [Streptomyces minutiscleroticus]|uniref:serine/threonine-protein kinase n=1 Tax=Streptomyces minutiscleroticus TaxID=68238 RepID=UPI00332CBB74